MRVGDLKYTQYAKYISQDDFKILDAILNTYYYYDGYVKVRLFEFHKNYKKMSLFELFKDVSLGSFKEVVYEILNKEIKK